MTSSPWHCDFTYVSLPLAFFYLTVLVLVIRYLWILWPGEKRSAQKTFLSFVVLQCVCRTIYFFAWPFSGPDCRPATVTGDFHWTDVVATLPVAFFLSAFSVLTYTFSRIYHTVLRQSGLHAWLHTAYVFALLLLNLSIYTIIIVALPSGRWMSAVSVWVVAASTFLVALSFLVYGVSLYRDVERTQDEARRQWIAAPVQENPMRRIAIVACICMVCFLVRTTLLPITADKFGFTAIVAFVYFTVSEIVPLLLMLNIFDGSATSGRATREHLSSSDPLLRSRA